MNPLDFTGPAFLAFYVVVFGVLFFVCRLARIHVLNPVGVTLANPSQLSPFEVAYLSGGPHGAVDAAVASLVKQGLVHADEARIIANAGGRVSLEPGIEREIERTAPASSLESEVLSLVSRSARTNLHILRKSELRALEKIRIDLEELGFVVRRGPWLFLAWGGPFLLLMLLGVAKATLGHARERPVSFLVILLVFTLAYSVWFLRGNLHLTIRGRELLDNLREQNHALSLTAATAPRQLAANDIALAYGLFGTAALTGFATVVAQINALGAPVDADVAGADARFREKLRKPEHGGCGSGGGGCGGGGAGGGGCGGGGGGGGCGGCGGGCGG